MLLPISVTGRVSDIWRSYITTRLMWMIGFHVAFVPPFVVQYRNPHSYMQDFEDERDLYGKTDAMLIALATWAMGDNGTDDLPTAYRELISHLASHGFLGHS